MQNLFGVDRQEAARSGLKEYDTTAGWQNITFSLIPIWAINKKWSLSGVFSVKRFVGQAAKSPIVDNTTTLFAGISVMYQLLEFVISKRVTTINFKILPVIQLPSSDARNKAIFAISLGVPVRFSGILFK